MKNKSRFQSEKYIQSIVVGKTKSSLRISFIIFLSFLILFSTIFITSVGEYSRMQKDYYDNHNTHIIEVDSKSKTSFYDKLNFEDLNILKDLGAEQAVVWCEHQINFGIVDDKENNYSIYSYSDGLYDKINLNFADKNICYSGNSELNNTTILLKVPIITVSSDTFESYDFVEVELLCKYVSETDIATVNNILNNQDNLIISEKAYYDIVEYMFNLNQSELVDQVNNDNNLGISPVSKVLMYCEDLKSDNTLANEIADCKYNTNYVFSYFDNMTESINTSKLSVILVLIILLIITSVNLLLSFELYFKNLQKDLGVLKHYNYKNKQIFKIYINKFFKWFACVAVLIIVYNFALSYFFINYKLLNYFSLICISEIVYVMILFFIIGLLLWIKCKKPAIELLKFSKEFE